MVPENDFVIRGEKPKEKEPKYITSVKKINYLPTRISLSIQAS